MSSPELSQVVRRLTETVAWCHQRVALTDPKNSLRTPALRPTHLAQTPNPSGTFEYDWGTEQDRQVPQKAVAALAQARADLLRQQGVPVDASPVDLGGGRLLIFIPEDSDWCGLSQPESAGFIDDLDVPAWDTWVDYIQEPVTPGTPEPYGMPTVSYLLCWVPPPFLTLASAGISVNPTECFFWAVEYKERACDTPLLRQLDAHGLLT